MTTPTPMSSTAGSRKPVIVVLGATGRQGGAVAESLARDGRWTLRVLTRDPSSDGARTLRSRGFEVVAGNMDDAGSLARAFDGAHGVFSAQASDQHETRRGVAVADAAQRAGVAHLVYSSAGGAERDSGVPHFQTKWRVEQHLRTIDLPSTVVRPVFFMENLSTATMRLALTALMRHHLPEHKPLQMIAAADIGDWVARAFADPDRFIGRAEEIAGDELTRRETISALRAGGLAASLPFPVPGPVLKRLPGDVGEMFAWFGREGYRADIPRLRAEQPGLKTLRDWVESRA